MEYIGGRGDLTIKIIFTSPPPPFLPIPSVSCGGVRAFVCTAIDKSASNGGRHSKENKLKGLHLHLGSEFSIADPGSA